MLSSLGCRAFRGALAPVAVSWPLLCTRRLYHTVSTLDPWAAASVPRTECVVRSYVLTVVTTAIALVTLRSADVDCRHRGAGHPSRSTKPLAALIVSGALTAAFARTVWPQSFPSVGWAMEWRCSTHSRGPDLR